MIGDIAKIVTEHTIEIERLKERLELAERRISAIEYLADIESEQVGHLFGFPVFRYRKKPRRWRSFLRLITPVRTRI